MELFVVTSGLRAKLRERPPCEFVELEDGNGRGQGPATGADWSECEARSSRPLYKLGPFAAVTDGGE